MVKTHCTLAWILVLAAAIPVAHGQGPIVGWGYDNEGEVSNIPAGNFLAVSGTWFSDVALRTNGTLASWGFDSYGQVTGTPTTGIYTAVAGGYGHSLALRSDGTIAAWGWDLYDQVTDTPTGTFTQINAGGQHSVAIRTDGTIASWGWDNANQISNTPTGTFSSASAGDYHSVALRTNGTLASWGADGSGQVSNTPTGSFLAVSAGSYHGVAIRSNGTLVSWGQDLFGQVSNTPAGTYVAVSGGGHHSVAMRADGTLVSWGRDVFGQVSNTPSGSFFAVSAGYDHTVAISAAVPPVAECTFEPDQVLCDVSKTGEVTGDFVVTGPFTNLQDIPGTHLLLPPNTVSPPGVQLCFGDGSNSLPLGTPLNNGDSYEIGQDLSNADAIIIKNAMPGDEVCFRMILISGVGEVCCNVELCLVMPPCDCFQIDHRYDEFICLGTNDDFSYLFRLTNLFGQDVYHAFVSEITPVTFSPDYFDLAMLNGGPLGQGQSMFLGLNISGTTPGQPIHFLLTIHNEDFSECCTREVWIEAPQCFETLNGDMNGDGQVNLLDVAPFVAMLTSGIFDPAADINMDGVVDLNDVNPFMAILTGG